MGETCLRTKIADVALYIGVNWLCFSNYYNYGLLIVKVRSSNNLVVHGIVGFLCALKYLLYVKLVVIIRVYPCVYYIKIHEEMGVISPMCSSGYDR